MKTTNITIRIQCNLEDIKEISSVTKDNIKTYIIKFNSIYKTLQFYIGYFTSYASPAQTLMPLERSYVPLPSPFHTVTSQQEYCDYYQ